MSEQTTIKVDKPVVDWLNSLKGFLEWRIGKRYTLNQALIAMLADFDVRNAVIEGKIDISDEKQIMEYLKRRLKQFWGDSKLPNVHFGVRPDPFGGR